MSRFMSYPPRAVALLLLFVALVVPGQAQKKKSKSSAKVIPPGRAVMWEPVNASNLDLYEGPGGAGMHPDLSSVKFIKEEKKGANKKYRISDGSGRIWIAKLGREARPETAAVRLLYGLGYKTEINYLVPTLTIPGKGTFKDVRLEARPDDVKRVGEWKWKSNPFVGTKELQGLKMMMVFLSNWDVVDIQNEVLHTNGENHYIVSDLGATFGKLGNNNLPVIYRLGRKTGNSKHYARTQFVRGVERGEVRLSYKGKNRSLFRGFTIAEARWLYGQLSHLTDDQIRDAFRAANYSPNDIETFTRTVRRKINELERAVGSNLALN